MNSAEERMIECFSAVFPERTREELLNASPDSIPEWDSLASVTLVTLIQQEFGVEIDLLSSDTVASFPVFLAYLRDYTSGAGEHGG